MSILRRSIGVREVFIREPDPEPESAPVISLGTLALSLNCLVAALVPLVEHGVLRRKTLGDSTAQVQVQVSSQTLVEAPPGPALLWLRSWLQPAQAKPLWSGRDLAGMLDCTSRDVDQIAATAGLPGSFEPALGGLVYSTWAARQIIQHAVASSRDRDRDQDRSSVAAGARWDRAAILWMILGEDPDRVMEPAPVTYSEALESEIARVASLPEPERTIRATDLIRMFRDAQAVAAAAATAVTVAATGSPAIESGVPSRAPGDLGEASGSEKFELRFSQLQSVVNKRTL